jgi:hypothetical protein
MASCRWLPVDGFLSMASRRWLPVDGFPSMASCRWLPVDGFPSMASRRWLPVDGFPSMASCRWLPVDHVRSNHARPARRNGAIAENGPARLRENAPYGKDRRAILPLLKAPAPLS